MKRLGENSCLKWQKKLNQTREKIKQKFKLINKKNRKEKKNKLLYKLNLEEENVRNLDYQNYSLI